MEKPKITVEATIHAPIEKVWNYWTSPEHIIHWNNASDDWHTPSATNDLQVGGKFSYRMQAKDQSFGFDFGGTYTKVVLQQKIDYTMDDERTTQITFISNGSDTKVIETFEAESENPLDLQQTGWQMILNNFKKYTESN